MCLEDEEVITVGSSAYNLAGDVNNRGNFMKNTILNMIFSGTSKKGLGTGIVDSHIAGPATSYIRFNKWAETSGYNTQVGNFGGLVYSANALSPAGFQYLVPVNSAYDQRAITFSFTALNLHLIALEWIINNSPANRDNPFKATLERVPVPLLFGSMGETFSGKILITYTSGATVAFMPAYNLNNSMPFVYLYHEERLKLSQEIIDTGWVSGTPPAKSGFTGSPSFTTQTVVLTSSSTTTTSYSDSTPTSSSSSSSEQTVTFYQESGTYTKITTVDATTVITGYVTTLVQDEESYYVINPGISESSSSSVSNGVTTTTTTTSSNPYLETHWNYHQVSTKVIQEKWLPFLLKIYQKGSSSVGDSLLFNVPTTVQKFFPVIPLRRDNVMVDLANFPTQYDWNRKAARKCFGTKKKYDKLIESLADNPSLGDIDNAWVVFGVSLSTKQQDGQKYLFEFFKNLSDTTISSVGTYKNPSAYEAAWADFAAATAVSTNDETGAVNRPSLPVAQKYAFTVNASAAAVQDWLYNITITAKGGSQTIGTGYHTKALGKVGHCWVYAKRTLSADVPTHSGDWNFTTVSTVVIAFGKQVTSDNWVEYEFFDLVHVNNVYQGVSTTTLGASVIGSTDENSSFIIPLHKDVFTELTLVRRTQLSLECSFLIVNYHSKQTIPWYSSGFFQIILVVVVIVVAVNTGYIGPESAGVLGTNAAVGANLGFALGSTAAVVAGAIANAVAAAIVASLITQVSTKLLGKEVGGIVGFIASAIAISAMSSTKAFSLADSWTQMTKADNLIRMSMSGVQQYGAHLQSEAMEINAKTQALMLESNKALEEIHRLTQELLGDTGVNPTTITDAIRYATENPAQFFNRTTMTGTEIAEISIKLVEDFPAPQLALPYLD